MGELSSSLEDFSRLEGRDYHDFLGAPRLHVAVRGLLNSDFLSFVVAGGCNERTQVAGGPSNEGFLVACVRFVRARKSHIRGIAVRWRMESSVCHAIWGLRSHL
jgi:hypothetical protein